MKDLDKLDAFVESVVSKDDKQSESYFSTYLTEKLSNKIQEFTGDNPIKLKGDDVFVNGKHVGTIDIDLDDYDAGISYTTSDKRFSKEFDDMETLYNFLADRYNVRESEVASSLDGAKYDERLNEAKKAKRLEMRIKNNDVNTSEKE